ncbi:Nuclear inhibitor of protein phosphatase 1 [Pseudolycoriella hygida]|uniref:Nuclear inhibitor of protein phosphatase 1 n=1 Tax=Pseudolycoriella hygida TaxID=35572 RepID=A0A9Q0MYG4_9DIPT|nr:Nuclear inhibitor of protein phosphatase 1 [Pseudolycoriella hygida]
MIDEKKCYLFGRNPQLNDFCIDHSSCSRVHAAYVYHKHLNISYLVDLGSTHGTFIGNLQIEPHKPTQLHINSTFHFGASTRYYTLRERPTPGSRSSNNIMEDIPMNDMSDGSFLIPETQMELDNLTEYNTAHNRRISMLGITDDNNLKKSAKKKKRRSVTFNEEEIVINPEDINPAIGRFRNLIQTTVVPAKRIKLDTVIGTPQTSSELSKHMHPSNFIPQLYEDLPPATGGESSKMDTFSSSIDSTTSMSNLGSKLGILFPNPAPEVTPTISESDTLPTQLPQPSHKVVNPGTEHEHMSENLSEPKKKKYAKEAWPGRKPLLNSF